MTTLYILSILVLLSFISTSSILLSNKSNGIAFAFSSIPPHHRSPLLASSSSSSLNAIVNNNDNNNESNNNNKKDDTNNERMKSSSSSFSLSTYQKNRALETFTSLDASRFHFQILFVDTDNTMGRISEGLLARIAEYNDALFVLFPSSATTVQNENEDGMPSAETVQKCETLGLCEHRSTELGTSFELENDLDEYDLIIVMNDEMRSLLLRSIPVVSDQQYYSSKIRLLSDFLSTNNNCVSSLVEEEEGEEAFLSDPTTGNNKNKNKLVLHDMLEYDLYERVEPYQDFIIDNDAMIVNSDIFSSSRYDVEDNDDYDEDQLLSTSNLKSSWSMTEAALILATAGITQFCLSTIDLQMDQAYQRLLKDNHFFTTSNQSSSWNSDIDDQIRRCSSHLSGYFSPQQRKEKYNQYYTEYYASMTTKNTATAEE